MMNDREQLLARLIDRVDRHYFGKYRGHVTDNNDPNNLGRIKATVPRVLGEVESGWALPAFIYGGSKEEGLFALPSVGAGVWIEFEAGDLSYPVWTGTWYTGGDIPESADFNKKVFKTTSGHKLVFDDKGGTLEITDSNANTITMDANNIKITAGNATTVVVDAPKIQLVDGASHPLVFGDELLQYLTQIVQMYQNHMHPGEVAPPSGGPVTPAPPTPPMPTPTSSLLSTKVTAG